MKPLKQKGRFVGKKKLINKIGKLIEISIFPQLLMRTIICHHAIGSIHDLPKRKRGEERLKQSESRFRNLFENRLQKVILVLDIASEKFIKANKTASKLLFSN